jgi:DNA primase
MTVKELLDKKKIPYKQAGRDYVISCLNPEHDDSNPSLKIDMVQGIMHCLSCGFKGQLFKHFGEKIDRANLLREKVKRQIEDVRANSIGLKLPIDAEGVTTAYRVSLETLQEFGAFRSLNHEYAGRIMFPIRDLKDKIACFVGRTEDPLEPMKYRNVPANSKMPLFPLQKIKPVHGAVMLVEGLFDMLNLWDNGFRNVLCTFGTKTVTKEKLQLLQVLGISSIDICFDPDEAGQNAAKEIRELAEELYFNVRNINLQNADPGELSSNRATKLREKLYG